MIQRILYLIFELLKNNELNTKAWEELYKVPVQKRASFYLLKTARWIVYSIDIYSTKKFFKHFLYLLPINLFPRGYCK